MERDVPAKVEEVAYAEKQYHAFIDTWTRTNREQHMDCHICIWLFV